MLRCQRRFGAAPHALFLGTDGRSLHGIDDVSGDLAHRRRLAALYALPPASAPAAPHGPLQVR